MTNVTVLPGLGSLMGGRRVGWVQAAIASVGFVMSVGFLIDFLRRWAVAGAYPPPDSRLAWGTAGVAVFGVAWLWSLATGFALVRAAPKEPDSHD